MSRIAATASDEIRSEVMLGTVLNIGNSESYNYTAGIDSNYVLIVVAGCDLRILCLFRTEHGHIQIHYPSTDGT